MSDLKIFTDNIEPQALNQIYTLVKHPAFADCKVRIMPDVHAGAGCVIGFTADLGDKVIPNIVGVDIGCGMLCVELGNVDIDLAAIDSIIRKYVPSGRDVYENGPDGFGRLEYMRCFDALKNVERLRHSVGTLGGGNHFIEIDEDKCGGKYLIIHSGSRNLGKQVAEYYQGLAIDAMCGRSAFNAMQEQLIADYKKQGRQNAIAQAIKNLRQDYHPNPLHVPRELCYLTGKSRENYLHDMMLCQDFATLNRIAMAETIIKQWFGKGSGLWEFYSFQTVHNYIELGSNMVRKGAISAKAGEKLLIPINMRDGCIIGVGKGNEDWNCSAPHGAGRIMSRSKAKQMVSLDEFEKSMEGIYTTSVSSATLDESPMAYKPIEEIISNIGDTVEIRNIIKPIYNFKASD